MIYKILTIILLLATSASAQVTVVSGDILELRGGPCAIRSGSIVPEGIVVGNPCDVYINTSNGVIWEKWVGSTAAGWGVGHNTNSTINGTLDVTGYVGQPGYVSQTIGWKIDALGAADFRYLYTDELHAKAFIADLEQALAGGQIITKSVTMLGSNFTNPAAGGATTLVVRDLPSAENMAVFESGDTVRLRTFSRASGSLTIADSYGVVTSYIDQGDGIQNWTFTRNTGANAGSMATSTIIQTDSIVLDYGVSGNGFHEVNAIDGLYGINSPYSQVATWTTSPIAANLTLRNRLGNLRGITGNTGEYGLIAGTYAATNGQYFLASNNSFELHGINLSMWDGATNTIKLDRTAPSFAMGSPVPSAYGTGIGCWQGKDAGVYKWRCGNPAGDRIEWNGTNLNVVGTITITGGGSYVPIGGAAADVRSGVAVPSGSGLFLGSDKMGYYAGGAWMTYMDNAGNFYLGGTGGALQWNGTTLTIAATMSGNGSGITSISGGNITTGSITATEIAADTITAGQIAANAITASEINAGAVTATKISVTTLSAIAADMGTLTAGTISGGTIDGATIRAGSGDEVTLNSSGITLEAGLGSNNGYKFEGAGIGMFYDTSVNVIYSIAAGGFNWETTSNALAFTSNGLITSQLEDLGASGTPWDRLFLEADLFWASPPTTTSDDDPIVYSSGNVKLYRKTNGITATCTNPTSIEFQSGIVVACS